MVAHEDSRLTATASWIASITRHSLCYRWLTAEPEPEVIVIDLRDTYTIGPVVTLLDRLVDSTTPSWRRSRLKRSAHRLVPVMEAASKSKTGRTVVKLLEPPETSDTQNDK